MQEIIGEFPSNKHKLLTFAVACIAAANQCDNNMKGRPLFAKSLAKATYIAQNFEWQKMIDLKSEGAMTLQSFEQWDDMFFNKHGYLINYYN